MEIEASVVLYKAVVLNTINQPLTHKKYEVRINLCVQASGQRIHPEVQHPSLRSELSVKSIVETQNTCWLP
jgi:hypothetical protein